MKQTWDKVRGSISFSIPLNAKCYVLNHAINPKRMPNVCVNDKTDEVILFLLKIKLDVQCSIVISDIHPYCNNKNDRYWLLKAIWNLSLICWSTFAQCVAPRLEIVFLPAFVETRCYEIVLVGCISCIMTMNFSRFLKKIFKWCWQHFMVKFMHKFR